MTKDDSRGWRVRGKEHDWHSVEGEHASIPFSSEGRMVILLRLAPKDGEGAWGPSYEYRGFRGYPEVELDADNPTFTLHILEAKFNEGIERLQAQILEVEVERK